MYEVVTPKTNQTCHNKRLHIARIQDNLRMSQHLLSDHEYPSRVKSFILTLKISRHNKQQLLTEADSLHKYVVIYESHQEQEFGFNRNSRSFILSPAHYRKSTRILE